MREISVGTTSMTIDEQWDRRVIDQHFFRRSVGLTRPLDLTPRNGTTPTVAMIRHFGWVRTTVDYDFEPQPLSLRRLIAQSL